MKTFVLIISILLAAPFAKGQATTSTGNVPPAIKDELSKMFDGYLKLEAALMQGNSQQAAKEASELNKLGTAAKTTGLSGNQLRIFNKQIAGIVHNTEHIGESSGNFPHQCEHFDYVTDEFYTLLKTFKFNTTPVYYNYTKEGNEANSAHWLTDKDDMGDPYFKGAKHEGDKRIEALAGK